MTRPALRIVIADDERMVRTALRVILEAEPDLEVVGEAAPGRRSFRWSVRWRPTWC